MQQRSGKQATMLRLMHALFSGDELAGRATMSSDPWIWYFVTIKPELFSAAYAGEVEMSSTSRGALGRNAGADSPPWTEGLPTPTW